MKPRKDHKPAKSSSKLSHKLAKSILSTRARLDLAKRMKEVHAKRQEQNDLLLRNAELIKAMTASPDLTILQTKPDKEWVEFYRKEAIEQRMQIVKLSLKALAVMEGVRVASKNITDDYGFDAPLDTAHFFNMVKQTSQMEMLHMLLSNSCLKPAIQNKSLEQAAIAIFGPEKAKTAVSDIMRNLSTTASPFSSVQTLRVGDANLDSRMAELHSKPTSAPVSSVHGFAELSRTDRLNRIKTKLGMD